MGPLIALTFLFGIGFIVLMVIVIVNVINNQEIDSTNKLFWIVLILVTNLLGLIIYFVVHDKNVLK